MQRRRPLFESGPFLTNMRAFGPSGSFERDDMDNCQECTRGCRGAVSRRMLLSTQMGLGHERFDPDLNAWASDFRMTESNYGQFYRRWVQLLGADSWTRMPTGGASEAEYVRRPYPRGGAVPLSGSPALERHFQRMARALH
jgi:hypothetical protein